jgi:hypothetical protein
MLSLHRQFTPVGVRPRAGCTAPWPLRAHILPGRR